MPMTVNPPNRTRPRRILLLIAAAVLCVAALWIGLFLSDLEPNDYREQIQEQLSKHLSLPVVVGELRLRLHDTSVALRIADFHIGDDGSRLQLHIPEVLADLSWRGLLRRRIEFSEVSLVRPLLRLGVPPRQTMSPPGEQEESSPLLIDRALLDMARIRKFEIISGRLHAAIPGVSDLPDSVEINELDGEFENIGLNRRCEVSLKGLLRLPGQEQGSHWNLEGSVTPSSDEQAGLDLRLGLDLTTTEFAPGPLAALLIPRAGLTLDGQSRLHLHLEGSPAGDLSFRAELEPDGLQVTPGPAYRTPRLLAPCTATGRLRLLDALPALRELQIASDGALLAGDIFWGRGEQAGEVGLVLRRSVMPLAQLRKWLPDLPPGAAQLRRGLLPQGELIIEAGQLTARPGRDGTPGPWQAEGLRAALHGAAWKLPDGPLAELDTLRLELSGRTLTVGNGSGRVGSTPCSFDGKLAFPPAQPATLSLTVHGEVTPRRLFADWAFEPPFTLSGKTSFTGHLEGPVDQLRTNLLLNLAALRLALPGKFTLEPNGADRLVLLGTLTPQAFTLDHGDLKWAFLDGSFSASVPWKELAKLGLDARLSVPDLATLAAAAPSLRKLALEGQADLEISQRGDPRQVSPQLTLTLREAGLATGRFVADLSHINGRVRINRSGLVAEKLRAHLGSSPVTVRAEVKDFAAPRLELAVKASQVRANELIFHSEKALLHDIDGRLVLDGEGLTFEPVEVRLDQGTRATVRGGVAFGDPVKVELDISGDFADVGEIVSLWTDAPRQAIGDPPTTSTGQQHKVEVTIRANAREGNLYGMRFQKASALILPTLERLVIHPLDFSVGAGYCNAQVVVEFDNPDGALLRISGHGEDIDALEVYRELLNQENIVRGRLRGDFYLEGLIGSQYLPSSHGRFSIEVHEGVLHKFQVLSKVFSLLNVSQLFNLSLPEMNSKGMPFSLLKANFALDAGVLSSDDLFIRSEAMNQAYTGSIDLVNRQLDLAMALHPLGTVDKIVSRIPVAGWLLTGEKRALLTTHFTIKGPFGNPKVNAVPVETLSDTTFGVLKRTLGLPMKLIRDPQILWGGQSEGK